MQDARIRLAGGRELAFTTLGDPDGARVFFFHGAPMSRLHLAYLEDDLASAGLCVVAPDRPGYGGSSPAPGRSLIDWPADVAALADALGIETFLASGHSSGGAYAVACCALLPHRVSAGVVIAGVTDMGWPPAWDHYTDLEVGLMQTTDEAAALALCSRLYGADGSGFLEGGFPLPDPDLAWLAEPAHGTAITAALQEAFRQGVTGYAQDIHVQGHPWTFDPGRISAPVEVVHGADDTLIPVGHSRHTAELIPGATLRVLPGHGHVTIVSELPAIARRLAGPDPGADAEAPVRMPPR